MAALSTQVLAPVEAVPATVLEVPASKDLTPEEIKSRYIFSWGPTSQPPTPVSGGVDTTLERAAVRSGAMERGYRAVSAEEAKVRFGEPVSSNYVPEEKVPEAKILTDDEAQALAKKAQALLVPETQPPYDLFVGHGPCFHGRTALAVAWMQLPPAVQIYLAKYGGWYAMSEHKTESKGDVMSQEQALKILEEWSLPGYHPVAFAIAKPGGPFLPQLLTGRRVVVMDLDPQEAIVDLMTLPSSCLLLDHHASTRKCLLKVVELGERVLLKTLVKGQVTVKVNRVLTVTWAQSPLVAGCTLAWQHFNPGQRIPLLIEAIQIGDTWNWDQRNDSKALHTAIVHSGYLKTFETIFHGYANLDCEVRGEDAMIKDGQAMLDHEARLARTLKPSVGYIRTPRGKYTVLYVQCNMLVNEVGDVLRRQGPKDVVVDFTATWRYEPRTEEVTVSLRSPQEGLDLGQLAQEVPGTLRGGGHPAASGFTFKGLGNLHKFLLKA